MRGSLVLAFGLTFVQMLYCQSSWNDTARKQPIASFGNSASDFQKLGWTTASNGARSELLVHHDDAERESAYDRKSSIGKLERGLTKPASAAGSW